MTAIPDPVSPLLNTEVFAMAIPAAPSLRRKGARLGKAHKSVAHCADHLDWPIALNADGAFLSTDHGVVGLTAPAGLAGEVNTEIKRREINVPIIAVPGRPGRWIFLVRQPMMFPGLLVGLGIISGTAQIPLPPTKVGDKPIHWVCEPSEPLARLPEFWQVLQAFHHVLYARTV